MNLGATRITGLHPQFLKTVAFLWRISSFWTIYVTTHLLKSSASRDVSKLTLPEDWYCSNRPSWIACCSLQFKAGRSFCHWVQSKPWKKYLVGGFNIFNPFENISQTGSSPQVVVKMKNIWVATTRKKNIDLSRIGFIIWRNSTFRLQQSNQQSHNLCSWMSSKKTVKLLYFEWSPPWHVGWRLSGEGCQGCQRIWWEEWRIWKHWFQVSLA